jgi:hypothetical protein
MARDKELLIWGTTSWVTFICRTSFRRKRGIMTPFVTTVMVAARYRCASPTSSATAAINPARSHEFSVYAFTHDSSRLSAFMDSAVSRMPTEIRSITEKASSQDFKSFHSNAKVKLQSAK